MTYTPNYSNRRVYWADQETVSSWNPSAVDTAGSFDLATDGDLVCGHAIRGQTLLWTTTDCWAMTYIGGVLIYSFQRIGTNCGIVSANAFSIIDTGAYWMAPGQFFRFDGYIQPIPCDVDDYVFGNFNSAQASKVWTLANPRFNEVTWFYPSSGATDPDRYVTYNYVEGHWSFGTLGRSIGVSQQAGATTPVPVMIDSAGRIYDHETGDARTGTVFLESGPVELADGDQVMRLQRIVPDDKVAGQVTAYLFTSMFPDNTETLNGPYTLASPTSIRLTARQVRLRLVEVVSAAWRIGVVRLGAIVSGRR